MGKLKYFFMGIMAFSFGISIVLAFLSEWILAFSWGLICLLLAAYYKINKDLGEISKQFVKIDKDYIQLEKEYQSLYSKHIDHLKESTEMCFEAKKTIDFLLKEREKMVVPKDAEKLKN